MHSSFVHLARDPCQLNNVTAESVAKIRHVKYIQAPPPYTHTNTPLVAVNEGAVCSMVVVMLFCSPVVTCWERADPLALLYAMFYCVFVTCPCDFLGQVWCLIVSTPNLCLLSYFHCSLLVLLCVRVVCFVLVLRYDYSCTF